MALFGILVCGIDFSGHSRRALRAAHDLARRFDGRVVAVHAVDPLLAHASATAGAEDLERSALAELKSFVEADVSLDANVDLVVRVGPADRELRAVAAEAGADLIVVGTQGLGGMEKLFFGSVTERVLRDSEIAVLAMPCDDPAESGPRFEPDGTIAAVDLERGASEVIAYAAALAEELGTPLTIANVVETNLDAPYSSEPHRAALLSLVQPEQRKLEQIALPLAGRLKVHTEVRLGSPPEQIAALAAGFAQAIVVIGLGGRGLLRRPGSTAYRVLCVSKAAVITVPNARSGSS